MKAFDFAGCKNLPHWPHAARGPRVGKPWSKIFQYMSFSYSSDNIKSHIFLNKFYISLCESTQVFRQLNFWKVLQLCFFSLSYASVIFTRWGECFTPAKMPIFMF